MAQFKAFAPNVEVNGQTVLSIVDGMGIFKRKALEALAKAGIVNPQPNKWYSQQAWLDAFKEISSSGSITLTLIGKTIPEHAEFPPDIDTIEKGLASIDIAYHMNHRGGEIGYYKFTSIDKNHATVEYKNPYPCDFDLGIITAMAKKFRQHATVTHKSQSCRKNGEDTCIYYVSW